MKDIIGIYIRLDGDEIHRLRDHPNILPKYDPRVALADGRGLDIGRSWEELGVFLDGGVKVPDSGPTVGDHPMPNTDMHAMWSYVDPPRVKEMARQLRSMRRPEFGNRYKADTEDTQTDIRTGGSGAYGDRKQHMYKKMRELAGHYQRAADADEGMLVRIGERL